jgi:hypothetical protein
MSTPDFFTFRATLHRVERVPAAWGAVRVSWERGQQTSASTPASVLAGVASWADAPDVVATLALSSALYRDTLTGQYNKRGSQLVVRDRADRIVSSFSLDLASLAELDGLSSRRGLALMPKRDDSPLLMLTLSAEHLAGRPDVPGEGNSFASSPTHAQLPSGVSPSGERQRPGAGAAAPPQHLAARLGTSSPQQQTRSAAALAAQYTGGVGMRELHTSVLDMVESVPVSAPHAAHHNRASRASAVGEDDATESDHSEMSDDAQEEPRAPLNASARTLNSSRDSAARPFVPRLPLARVPGGASASSTPQLDASLHVENVATSSSGSRPGAELSSASSRSSRSRSRSSRSRSSGSRDSGSRSRSRSRSYSSASPSARSETSATDASRERTRSPTRSERRQHTAALLANAVALTTPRNAASVLPPLSARARLAADNGGSATQRSMLSDAGEEAERLNSLLDNANERIRRMLELARAASALQGPGSADAFAAAASGFGASALADADFGDAGGAPRGVDNFERDEARVQLEETVEQLRREMAHMAGDRIALEAQVRDLQSDVAQLEEEREQLIATVREVASDRDELTETLSLVTAEANEISARNRALEDRVDELRTRLGSEGQQQRATQDEVIALMQKQVSELQRTQTSTVRELGETRASLAKARAQCEQLERDLEAARIANAGDASGASGDVAFLRATNAELRTRADDAELQVRSLTAQLNALQTATEHARGTAAESRAALDIAHAQRDERDARIAALEATLEELRTNSAAAQTRSVDGAQAAELQASMRELQRQSAESLGAAQSEMAALRAARDDALDRLRDAEAQIDAVQRDLMAAHERVATRDAELERERASTLHSGAQLRDAQAALAAAQSEIAQLHAKLGELMMSVEHERDARATAEAALEQAGAQVARLSEQNKESSKELSEAHKRAERLRALELELDTERAQRAAALTGREDAIRARVAIEDDLRSARAGESSLREQLAAEQRERALLQSRVDDMLLVRRRREVGGGKRSTFLCVCVCAQCAPRPRCLCGCQLTLVLAAHRHGQGARRGGRRGQLERVGDVPGGACRRQRRRGGRGRARGRQR